MLFDVKEAEEAARAEIAEDRIKDAKKKIKTKLTEIAAAEAVVRNLKREYDVLMEDIGDN